MFRYEINCNVEPKQIAELRKSVGWNGMENSYAKSLSNSYLYVCCFEDNDLVGFLDVVSNGVTDAYIQDVIVNPKHHRKGIGTEMMNRAISKLKHNEVYAISVLFEEKLLTFYKKFGFNIMMSGQMTTREEE